MGRDTAGMMAIKGLALSPSLSEVFAVRLMEDPTCLCIASRQPMLVTGYEDGTVTATRFDGDRCDKSAPLYSFERHTVKMRENKC